ncbi:MAG: hypothetical protein QM726_15790 [Chitinophagaceae bacterium]
MPKFLSTFIFLLIITTSIYSQVNDKFKLDSLTIYTNENLDSLTFKLKSTHLKIYKDKNKIPQQVKEQLNLLTKDNFSIANKKEEYRCCCTSPTTLPTRQLQFLAVGNDFIAMTYLTGGVGVSTHILLASFYKSELTDLWIGSSFKDIKTKRKLFKALREARKEEYNLYWFL